MKHILLSIVSVAFVSTLVGCASSKKEEATKPAAATKEAASAEAKSAADKIEKTKDAAKVKKAAIEKTAGATVCMYEDVRREIAVVESEDRCVVEYTKDGEKKEIGTGLPKSPICQSIAEKVRANLETAGYKCE